MKFISQFLIVCSLGLASINCGGASHDVAPGNETEEGGLETPIVFATVTENVFNKYGCLNCHGITKKSANVDLSTYETVMNNPGLVIVDADPLESQIVKVIVKREMPPRGPQVSADDLNLLMAWIENGAPKE